MLQHINGLQKHTLHLLHLFCLFMSDTSLRHAETCRSIKASCSVTLTADSPLIFLIFSKYKDVEDYCQTCTAFPQHQQLWMKGSVRLSCLTALWETQCLPRDWGLKGLRVIKQNCWGQLVFQCFSGMSQPLQPPLSDIQILYIDTGLVKAIEENHYPDVRTSVFQQTGQGFWKLELTVAVHRPI